jgi:Tfp pilus assembly protein PilN
MCWRCLACVFVLSVCVLVGILLYTDVKVAPIRSQDLLDSAIFDLEERIWDLERAQHTLKTRQLAEQQVTLISISP